MEVDDIQIQTHVSKFQKVSSNGTTATSNNDVNTSSNQQKLAPSRANFQVQVRNHVHDSGPGVVGGGDGVARLCGWPSSRIVRVSRASGGKDRHSKVLTSKGLRDRRVRLSVSTAIQFYDLQDRLGFDQPSKAVEWLLKAAASSIDELPSLDPPFHGTISDCDREMKFTDRISQIQTGGGDNNVSCVKSPVSSSTSETSRGSGLSLSRSENRIKARERAREMVSKKEKSDSSTRVTVLNQVNDNNNNSNNMSENNSTFTDLLTGGINRSPMDYFFNRTSQIQIPQFNINTEENIQHQQQQQQQNHHHYSFLQNSFIPQVPVTTTGGGVNSGGEGYNLSFAMSSSAAGGGGGGGGGAIVSGGFSRGTLQSNLQSSLLSNHHHLQRFQPSSIDGSTSPNLPFLVVQNTAVDHYPVTTGGYQLNYAGDGSGGRRLDHHKDKSKN